MGEKKEREFKKYKQLKSCPKCGSGMGEHSDRYTCGRCGYTEFKIQKQQPKDKKQAEAK